MGPNDQYSYYYNSNTGDQSSTNNYSNYSSRPNQFNQHTRPTSTSTPAQPYNYSQNTYANDQTQQSNNQNYYGNARDGDQRAAETLSRMGSGTTNPSSTATAFNHTQTADTHGTNYNSGSSSQYTSTLQNTATTYPSQQKSYATASAHQLARPNSVNSARSAAAATRSPIVEPQQQPRANFSAQYSRTQLASIQRSTSPAQIQASHQLQRLADQRAQETTQVPQTNQQSFVDPSAVYDPWPEYQRKLVAARAAKEAEDKAAAEREAEEKRLQEEKDAAEEAERQLQEEQEKQRKKEEAAQKRAAKKAERDPNVPKKKRKSKGGAATEAEAAATAAAGGLNLAQLTAMAGAAPPGSDAEAQIRQLMAIVKQMNDKHPDLLAKIWEEERQQHLEHSSENPAPAADGASASPKKKKKTPKKVAASAAESLTPAPQPSTNDVKPKGQSKTTATPAQATSSTATPTTTTTPPSARPTALGKSMPKANNATRGTIWPPEKKGQIASAAVRWLSSLPGAPGQPPVTAQQISSMLDKNPTYIELCEMIEQLGFKVERAAFAKALLTSVPDVNANRSTASPAIPRAPSTGPLRTPVAPSAQSSATTSGNQAFARPPLPTTTSPTQIRLPDMQFPAYSSPYFDEQGEEIPTEKPAEAKTAKGKSKKKATDKKEGSADGGSNRPSETPGPATKAEAARKRTFADLVDLTALSDDEELLPPSRQAYFGPPPVTQPGQAYSTKLDFLPNFDGASVIDPHLQRAQDRFGPPQTQQAPQSFERQQMMAVASKLNQHDLAKQVDRKDALRRSRYDIRTLARDVLLATGKHPDLLPLNGHLESLRNAFPNSISFNTDLATLRWDLIDGGEPIPEALAMVVSNDADSVIDEADDESEEDVRHFAVRAPSRMQSVAIGASGARGMGSTFVSMHPPINFTPDKGITPSNGRGRGRGRGRPPGFARFSTGGAQTPIGNHRPAGPPSSASPAPGSGSGGYSAFSRELRPDGTKRRGRPVGWRKAIHQRGVGIEAGGSGHTYANERPKQAPPPPPATEHRFTVYKCKWQHCSAELHNLQTLRKHVNKKHGVADRSGKFSCLWQDCGRQVQNITTEGAVVQSMQHFDFPDTGELMTHVEHRHIRPIGWELGDGPPGGFSDSNASDAEAYLSDQQGRRVTPTIQAAAPESSANTSAQRAPGTVQRGRPPKKTDEEKARESQADLARQKREIGLGVDRQGATFANEKRRAGFVDDEDGDEVLIDASD